MHPTQVVAIDGSILCVSQFTLCGRLQGNSPDYSKAMPPQEVRTRDQCLRYLDHHTWQAREMYERFLARLSREYGKDGRVQDGVFGAMMRVSLTNDGPVTWTLDSKAR